MTMSAATDREANSTQGRGESFCISWPMETAAWSAGIEQAKVSFEYLMRAPRSSNA